MSQYTVTITDSRLKMNFSAHCIRDRNHYMVTLHEIIFNSLHHNQREGLSIGDRLVAINDRLVCGMSINSISAAFAQQQLPLNLTLSPQPRNRRHFTCDLSMDCIAPPAPRTLHKYSGRKYSESQRASCSPALCAKYIRNGRNLFVSVLFDRCSVNRRNRRICLVASKGLSRGYHEWSVELLKCGIFKQEMGVVGTC